MLPNGKHFFLSLSPIINHIMSRYLYLIVVSLLISAFTSAQNYYRICGDFSIKSKSEDKAQLVMGRFYYDINEKKIIHNNTFPEKAKWVTADTSIYKIVDNAIVSRQTIPDFTPFSIYNIVLTNKLDNFGLDGSYYKLDKVEHEGDMVISTWVPQKSLRKVAGDILISSKNNNIYGVVFRNIDGKLLKKQFFEEYAIYNGLAFPGRIVEITYVDGKEIYQITTYKNILVNDHGEEDMYHFNPVDYQ